MSGDATGSTVYAAHDQVATLLTQLGLMPQIMNIKLASATRTDGDGPSPT